MTTALAASALGELLTPVQLVGGLLVLSAVVALQARPARAGAKRGVCEHADPARFLALRAVRPVRRSRARVRRAVGGLRLRG